MSMAYREPTGIALVSLLGLVSALVGDGIADAVSWAALGFVVLVLIRALAARGTTRASSAEPSPGD